MHIYLSAGQPHLAVTCAGKTQHALHVSLDSAFSSVPCTAFSHQVLSLEQFNSLQAHFQPQKDKKNHVVREVLQGVDYIL